MIPADEQTCQRNTVPAPFEPVTWKSEASLPEFNGGVAPSPSYICQCCHCGSRFLDSNKRAVCCKDCRVPTQDLDEQRREMPMIVWALVFIAAGVLATVLVCLHLLRTEIAVAPAAADVIEIDLDAPPAGGDWSAFDIDLLPPVHSEQ